MIEHQFDPQSAKNLHAMLGESIGHDCLTEAATSLAADAKRRKLEIKNDEQ